MLFAVTFKSLATDSFEKRAMLLIDYIADDYAKVAPGRNNKNAAVSDPEKYNWPAVIARFEKYGIADSIGNLRIETFRDNQPFHFTLIGMARIMCLYEDAPMMQKWKVQYIENVFARNDSYNAFFGEGTENHLNMNRTSAYLFAQEAMKYPEKFPFAASHLNEMKAWISYYSKRIFEVGTGEWNSSTYGLFNLIGWLNLYDFATDSIVKKQARAVLDYYACEIALHYTQGITGGAEMRGGKAVRSVSSITDYAAWLWFEDAPQEEIDFAGNNSIYSVHIATSSYRPDNLIIKLAVKNFENPQQYIGSKPSYLLSVPSLIKETFYISNNYTLGTVYNPYGGFGSGDYQMINWKLVARVDSLKSAQFVSGHGSLFMPNGLFRPPFDQFVHHKNVMVQMTYVPNNVHEIIDTIAEIFNLWKEQWHQDFSKRFSTNDIKLTTPDLSKGIAEMVNIDYDNNISYLSIAATDPVVVKITDSIMYVALEQVYIAIRQLHNPIPNLLELSMRTEKWYYLEDAAPIGSLCGFIIEVAEKSEYKSFSEFMTKYKDNTIFCIREISKGIISYKGLQDFELKIQYNKKGNMTEPIYDFGYGTIEKHSIITSPPYKQPDWPSGVGYGKIPIFWVNDSLIDFHVSWPVYRGTHFTLENAILSVQFGNDTYTVDYSDKSPVFIKNCF